ncbi:MAG: DUF2225 domain-containing protein [Kiritimatiellae bacterium]|nr:DUF2225 domain-containing protein [Kiritimatiellia bacterium]MDD4735575.1 DUF2225 domain-containing protein [Kiritimatiellia bacterium]
MERSQNNPDEITQKKKLLKDPFLRRQVTCPICEHAVEQLGLKTNLFRAEHKDVDRRPYSYRWKQENLAKFHPPFFYVWYCPKCYFAAGRKYYEEPLKDCYLTMRKFKETIQNKYKTDPTAKKIINKLTAGVAPDKFCFKQAFQLHLLAIYWAELFPELSKRDAMNLARYYLRIAWLFRDLNENEEANAAEGKAIQDFFADLKTVWPEVSDSDDAALRKANAYYEVTLGHSEIISNAVDELNVLLIVAQVYLKLADLKPALDALTAAVTSGTRSKQEIDTTLRTPQRDAEGQLSEKDKQELTQQSVDLRSLIDRARNMLDKVKEDWLAEQTAKAKKIMAANKGKTRTQLRQILETQSIEPRVVNRLLPVEQVQQKKGFLASILGG